LIDLSTLSFDKSGLIPVVVQDESTKDVLMLGYANLETLEETLETGRMVFFSRSRQQRWLKGETSGNFLHVKNVAADCDQDALLVTAHPEGPTCHLGSTTCFGANS
jgi:phosphoribosyl-ATP pyrophosphohydrolase/phosphoribosyl-AMP cyclohydrolase